MKESRATTQDGLEIHFIDNEGNNPESLPLVFVPGMMGIAAFHEEDLRALYPQRVISLTHRGLGKSSAIKVGQGGFRKRASDIQAVMDHLGWDRYYLYGFSRGVSLAVAHALGHPHAVAGLILHDCPPSYPKLSEKWRNNLIAANRPHIPAETIHAYWQDSEAIDLTDRLKEISCPVLILRGEQEGSLLSGVEADKMKKFLARGSISSLPHSAHELHESDRKIFLRALTNFIHAR